MMSRIVILSLPDLLKWLQSEVDIAVDDFVDKMNAAKREKREAAREERQQRKRRRRVDQEVEEDAAKPR